MLCDLEQPLPSIMSAAGHAGLFAWAVAVVVGAMPIVSYILTARKRSALTTKQRKAVQNVCLLATLLFLAFGLLTEVFALPWMRAVDLWHANGLIKLLDLHCSTRALDAAYSLAVFIQDVMVVIGVACLFLAAFLLIRVASRYFISMPR
jgi:hypothetical protein